MLQSTMEMGWMRFSANNFSHPKSQTAFSDTFIHYLVYIRHNHCSECCYLQQFPKVIGFENKSTYNPKLSN